MFFLAEWCLRNIDRFDIVHVHCDNDCAMNVSHGRWRVARNTVLAAKRRSLRCVKWTWSKGHTGNQGNERAAPPGNSWLHTLGLGNGGPFPRTIRVRTPDTRMKLHPTLTHPVNAPKRLELPKP